MPGDLLRFRDFTASVISPSDIGKFFLDIWGGLDHPGKKFVPHRLQ